MKNAFAAVCLFALLLANAMASDNNIAIAFARKNAEKFKTELAEVKGVAYGATVTLEAFLDPIELVVLSTKYDPGTEEMIVGSSISTLNQLMFSENCKLIGSFLGQNAFGVKTTVRRKACERFWLNDGDVMAVQISGARIKMSPSQFRAINKAGVMAEVDITIGHPKHDVTVEYQESVNDATIEHPVQSYMKVWTVYGRIEEIRWALPGEKPAKGAMAVLWRASQRP
ncbi:MAG: hypothetical protein K1X67_19170 [Fimbriimonadaceae bacterium]|nr:hypothetical protein [Fimbriimonadaceae bacterium]